MDVFPFERPTYSKIMVTTTLDTDGAAKPDWVYSQTKTYNSPSLPGYNVLEFHRAKNKDISSQTLNIEIISGPYRKDDFIGAPIGNLYWTWNKRGSEVRNHSLVVHGKYIEGIGGLSSVGVFKTVSTLPTPDKLYKNGTWIPTTTETTCDSGDCISTTLSTDPVRLIVRDI